MPDLGGKEEALNGCFTLAKDDDPDAESHEKIDGFNQKIKAFLPGQAGDQPDDRGVGFGAGGGPWSTWPSTAGIELGRLGPKTSHPRPAARTIAPATTSAFTSPGMVARTSRRLTGSRERALLGGASAGEAAATSSARARVMPQWHASARSGTRRPQLGHVQVWGVSSAIGSHPRPTPGVRS